MSWQATTWVAQHSKSKGSNRLVLLMIANHAHSDGTGAWPSYQTLANECHMSKRQIMRIIDQLERSGELAVHRGARPNSGHMYSLPLMLSGDILSPPSDILSPPVVTFSHLGGDIAMSPKESIETSLNLSKKEDAPQPKLTCLPPDFEVTDDMRFWAAKKYPLLDLEEATQEWLDYAKSKRVRAADWEAAWRNGMRLAAKWAKERTTNNGRETQAARALRIGKELFAQQQIDLFETDHLPGALGSGENSP